MTCGSASPARGDHRPTGAGEERKRPKRIWAQHKTEAVPWLLRGEDIETVSRELGVKSLLPIPDQPGAEFRAGLVAHAHGALVQVEAVGPVGLEEARGGGPAGLGHVLEGMIRG